MSTGTVSHVLARAEAAGLSWPLPSGLDDEALRARLYPAPDQDSDLLEIVEARHQRKHPPKTAGY